MKRLTMLRTVPAALLLATFFTLAPPSAEQVDAATTASYCETKYYCAYIEYDAPSGSSRDIANRWYKGSRGCAWDQFNNYTCGADQWRFAYFADDYRWPGDPTWYNDRTSSGSWYYNDTFSSWMCDCADNSMPGEAWRVRNVAQFYENGGYWHVPLSGTWIWYV